MNEKLRSICVGDIHGCLEEFDELIKKLEYNPTTDRMILLGDLIDRGEHSVGVVKKAREMKLESVMGNHEYKFIKWYRSQGSRGDVYDRKDHYNKFSDADITYITNMPTYIQLPEVTIVHAGVKPDIAIDHQTKDDLMYLRYTDDKRRFISLKKINRKGKKRTGAKFWTDFGPFGYNLVYGHNVHSFTDIQVDKYDDGTACYGLDTGACFGGRLTAMIWESKEIVQVQAKKVYYQSDFDIR